MMNICVVAGTNIIKITDKYVPMGFCENEEFCAAIFLTNC